MASRGSSWLSSQLLPEIEVKPWGVQLIERIKRAPLSFKNYQAIVLVVTFLAYTTYHATRKTTGIVKSTLYPKSPDLTLNVFNTSVKAEEGWAPFNGPDGTALLGELDLAFLSLYAFGMYFAGHLGDRMDLRIFLTIGMIGTGLFTALFGAAFWANIHNFYYFLVVQILAGLLQATGWPSVVSVVGHWFDKKGRGLIMGVWSAHTSVGNITGSLIASALLKYGWGWSFLVPGILISLMGIVVYVLLPVSPTAVGAERDGSELDAIARLDTVNESLLWSRRSSAGGEKYAVGFLDAWKIPGVAPFAFCLFFAKLVSYTFLYWLPFYVSHTVIDGQYLSDETAGNLSIFFDVGGAFGGILAGYISDQLDARASTAAGFMLCSIPALFCYRIYGHISLTINIVLMVLAGVLVNGPYALITSAVSADLGTHHSLRGNSRALATVSAIIDGTGSIGAAIGPLLTGYISAISWDAVFVMLMVAAFIASLLLIRLIIAEVAAMISGTSQEEVRPPPPPARPPIRVISSIEAA